MGFTTLVCWDFPQDWLSEAHALIDERHATSSSFLEKAVKSMMGKYINALGRFDLESMKIDLTTYMSDRKKMEETASAMAGMNLQ